MNDEENLFSNLKEQWWATLIIAVFLVFFIIIFLNLAP